jgi:hypothetical protein
MEKALIVMMITQIAFELGKRQRERQMLLLNMTQQRFPFFYWITRMNWFDWIEYSLLIFWLLVRISNRSFTLVRILLALSAIPLSLTLLWELSIIKPIGELVIIGRYMFDDISVFVIVYLLSILGFGIAFNGIFHGNYKFARGHV